jgi:hypothetical protein
MMPLQALKIRVSLFNSDPGHDQHRSAREPSSGPGRDRRRGRPKMLCCIIMRTARAKVVNGKIVTRARFPNGTKLFLVVDEPQPEVELEDDGEKAFDQAMVAVRRGEAIPLETFRATLQRL